jgi:hypothetical protein
MGLLRSAKPEPRERISHTRIVLVSNIEHLLRCGDAESMHFCQAGQGIDDLGYVYSYGPVA